MGWVAGFTKLMPLIGAAINLVEDITSRTKGRDGKIESRDKQESAMRAITTVAPLLGGVDLDTMFDPKVLEALRKLIDAFVEFMNAARDARAKRAA
jgi:hypothetical protein